MSSKKKSGLNVTAIKARMLLDKLAGKKTIILDIEETTFIPYILPIVKSLKKKSNKISYYIATYYRGDEKLKQFDVPLKKQFDVSLSERLPADLYLSTHIYGKGNKNSLRVHINHNQPVKYEAYQKKDFINFGIHFLTSPLHREQTENTIRNYNLEKNEIKLFDTGYAKSDDLLNGKFNKKTVLRELNLDPSLKTVLYAPSWDEGLSLRSFGEEVIKKILEVKKINVIVKLHPISYCPEDGPNYFFYTGGINWIKRLSEFDTYKNFRHVPTNSIDPLLAASDLMVTDVSSVALEFIMLDKPVIYIDCPDFFEKTLKKTYSGFGNTTADFVRNDPKANAGRHVGTVVSDIEQLPGVIEDTLMNPGKNSDKRKAFSKQLIYNPGKGADAAADKILNLLEL